PRRGVAKASVEMLTGQHKRKTQRRACADRPQRLDEQAIVGAPPRDGTDGERCAHAGARNGLDGKLMIRRARSSGTSSGPPGWSTYIGNMCIRVPPSRLLPPAPL